MASENFTLWDSVQFDNTVVTGNGVFLLGSSSIISNSSGLGALRVVLDYEDAAPESSLRNFGVAAVVESSNGEADPNKKWFPVAYQFEPFTRDFKGKTREIIMQPNLNPFDLGVDDTVTVGFDTTARISRQNGKLGSEFRVCLFVNEYGHGGTGAFQDVTVSGHGERFSV